MNRTAIKFIVAQKTRAEIAAFAELPFCVIKADFVSTLTARAMFEPVCQYGVNRLVQRGEIGHMDGIRYKIDTRKKIR